MEKIIIAGLGNPGKKYKNSPHNAGFSVIDNIAYTLKEQKESLKETNKKEVFICEASNENTHIVLVKPLLFMNNSGTPVKNVLDYFSVEDKSKLWVVHDDIDLPMGKVRISYGASSGGQKGVEDIIQKIGTQDFYRFRIGVRTDEMEKERDTDATSAFVTKKLRGKKRKNLQKSIELTTELVQNYIKKQEVEAGSFNV